MEIKPIRNDLKLNLQKIFDKLGNEVLQAAIIALKLNPLNVLY